jgi:ribonuclease P protein component
LAEIRETIRKKSEIRVLFKTGKRLQLNPLVVFYKKNSLDKTRYLFCADRSCKNAVQRNRSKRVLRAVVTELGVVPQGLDVALVAGIAYGQLSFTDRVSLLKKAFARIVR